MNSLNLDANASFRPDQAHIGELTSYYERLCNPSAIHGGGQRIRLDISEARERLFDLLGVSAGWELVFTSGATEANNQIFHSLGVSSQGTIAVSAVEHSSIQAAAERQKASGKEVAVFFPDKFGALNAERVLEQCPDDCCAVSLMLANNETGQIFQLGEITKRLRAKYPEVLIHSDIVQALGKIDFCLDELGIDLATISGHKIGALPGCGALLFRSGIRLESLIVGGPQEQRLRAGMENIPGIVSFGLVAERVKETLTQRIEGMQARRDFFEERLLRELDGAGTVFSVGARLPNTSNIRFKGCNGSDLAVGLDLEGIWVSSGAACASGKSDPSHVLLACGLSESEARESVRFSLHGDEAFAELEQAVSVIVKCVKRMQRG